MRFELTRVYCIKCHLLVLAIWVSFFFFCGSVFEKAYLFYLQLALFSCMLHSENSPSTCTDFLEFILHYGTCATNLQFEITGSIYILFFTG